MNKMKKFVGNVNGKEFTNVDEFTKAVNDAIASGESPMMISSYYKDCDCGCDEIEGCKCKKQVDEKKPAIVEDVKKPLDVNTILLTRESPKSGDTYKIPVNAKEAFDKASNIDEIKKAIDEKISANNTTIKIDNLQIGNLNKKIEEYTNKIADYTKDKDEAYSQIAYYNTLKGIIDDENKESEDEKVVASESLKKDENAYSLVSDMLDGFDKFLSDVGFWK